MKLLLASWGQWSSAEGAEGGQLKTSGDSVGGYDLKKVTAVT